MTIKIKEIKSNTYSIFTGNDIGRYIQQFLLRTEYAESKFFVIVDENSKKHCLSDLIKKTNRLKNATVINIKSGEKNKTIKEAIKLWNILIELKVDRNAIIINLGGGVICDIGGFVASTFKRGIRYINIPTTLLAQADAAIGGKVGIDLNNFKNQIGTFSNPEVVFINPVFLNTLDKRHLLGGFSEVIKHSLIADKSYWNIIRNKPFDKITNWQELIIPSVEIKNNIVISDHKERNLRKVLNFGHTIGHAVETYSLQNDKKPLLHGEAIAIGIICESYISYKHAGLPQRELNEITFFIVSNFKHYNLKVKTIKTLIDIMLHDKKNYNSKINFTLISSIGNALINQQCNNKLIAESLNYYSKLT